MANPIPQQLRLNVVSWTGNEAIVNVNGQDYKFTVSKGSGNSWQDITGTKDWRILAQHIAQLFGEGAQMLEGAQKFDSAEIILRGDFSDIETTGNIAAKTVALVSAKYSAAGHDREIRQENLNTLRPEFQTRITDTITQLGRDFAEIKPLTARNIRPGEVINPPRLEENAELVVDARVQICEGRTHSVVQVDRNGVQIPKPRADYALAQQLRAIPHLGATNYSLMPNIDAVVAGIQTDVSNQVLEPTANWNTGQKFADIFADLKRAAETDNAILTHAVTQYNPPGTDQRFLMARVNDLLLRQPDQLTADEKKHLAIIYAKYITSAGKYLGPAFFKAFVEKHADTDFFRITIIEEDPATGAKKAITYGDTRGEQIDSQLCAFLHFDRRTGAYSSYARQAVPDRNIVDLNTRQLINASERRVRSVPLPAAPAITIPTTPVPANGKCLSLAIVLQGQGVIDPNAQEAVLRRKAAEKIRADRVGEDEELFFQSLKASIGHIPAFSTEQRYASVEGGLIKELSTSTVKTMLGNEEARFTAIRDILAIQDYAAITAEQRTRLKNFYADYILYGAGDAYLDSAFLYVLQDIIDMPSFPGGIKCAIIQNGRIVAKFGKTELNTDNWVYVVYTGDNHYDIVNRATGTNMLKEIIQQEKDKILNEFLTKLRRPLPDPTSPEIIKRELLNLKNVYPKAYLAIAGLVYEHDLRVWNSMPPEQRLDQPGTRAFDLNGEHYPQERYGEWRLNGSWEAHLPHTPISLKEILLTFADVQIAEKIRSLR